MKKKRSPDAFALHPMSALCIRWVSPAGVNGGASRIHTMHRMNVDAPDKDGHAPDEREWTR